MTKIGALLAIAALVIGVGIWGAHGFDDPVAWAKTLASWGWPNLPHPLPC